MISLVEKLKNMPEKKNYIFIFCLFIGIIIIMFSIYVYNVNQHNQKIAFAKELIESGRLETANFYVKNLNHSYNDTKEIKEELNESLYNKAKQAFIDKDYTLAETTLAMIDINTLTIQGKLKEYNSLKQDITDNKEKLIEQRQKEQLENIAKEAPSEGLSELDIQKTLWGEPNLIVDNQKGLAPVHRTKQYEWSFINDNDKGVIVISAVVREGFIEEIRQSSFPNPDVLKPALRNPTRTYSWAYSYLYQ